MKFRAEVYTSAQLDSALNNPNIEMVYAPYNILSDKYLPLKERIILVPPLYLADCESELKNKLIELKKAGFNKVLVHTIGHIELFSSLGFDLYGGYRLNCLNSESILFFEENGVRDIIISPEITSAQINHIKNDNFGFIAYGYLPLMITRRCPLKNGKPCNKNYCKRSLIDRKGNKLNLICSENTAEILNSDVLYLADKINFFSEVAFAILKFTVEDNIDEIISSYVNSKPCENNNFTRGLYFRGIKE